MSSVQGSDGSRFSGGAARKWTDVREMVTFVWGPAKSRRYALSAWSMGQPSSI